MAAISLNRRARLVICSSVVFLGALVYVLSTSGRDASFATHIDFFPSSWIADKSVTIHESAHITDAERYVPLHHRDQPIPETKLVKGIAGFNYFHNLYFFNGSFYFVSSDPAAAGFPSESGPMYILSGPFDDETVENKGTFSDPVPSRWNTISPKEAQHILGRVAIRQQGVTHFFNDMDGIDTRTGKKVNSFLGHYYHFGEMFLGAWRLTVAAGDREMPSRIIYRAQPSTWRDRARITPWFQKTIMAGTDIEESFDLMDRTESKATFLFDKIAITDRWAAHHYGTDPKWWNKVIADLPTLKVPANWFEPLRDRVKLYAETAGCEVKRKSAHVPVVTYIDRRRLVDEDHALLIDSLQELDEEGLIEFVHAKMELLERVDQFCLAARTDIMLGVHGNGLSHQLWMLPGSGVLEIMNAPGFTRDYAILAELSHHEYYAIHNDTYLPPSKWRKENGYAVPQGPGFHGKTIRVHGPYVASLVKDMAERRRDGPTPFQW